MTMTTLHDELRNRSSISLIITHMPDHRHDVNVFKDFSEINNPICVLVWRHSLSGKDDRIFIRLSDKSWYTSDESPCKSYFTSLCTRLDFTSRQWVNLRRSQKYIEPAEDSSGIRLVTSISCMFIPMTRYSASHVSLLTLHTP